MKYTLPSKSALFQSTYLYKVRHTRNKSDMRRIGFNPRTYIRYDRGVYGCLQQQPVSIHVPI